LRFLRSIFRCQVWSSFFSLPRSDRFWAPYIRTGNKQDARKFFLSSQVFGIWRPL
jgi:hypothetical protein